ncbi:UNC51-like protein [Mya arenaria]|uniref:UNC51-like protein n=1 Tax=Mya arenaria TaxID=6604 RepID=A0ABY7E760_MYAAR|nr:UNC51-like protein [Mya arenaria]
MTVNKDDHYEEHNFKTNTIKAFSTSVTEKQLTTIHNLIFIVHNNPTIPATIASDEKIGYLSWDNLIYVYIGDTILCPANHLGLDLKGKGHKVATDLFKQRASDTTVATIVHIFDVTLVLRLICGHHLGPKHFNSYNVEEVRGRDPRTLRKRSGLSHTPSPPVFIYFPCTVHGDLTRASVSVTKATGLHRHTGVQEDVEKRNNTITYSLTMLTRYNVEEVRGRDPGTLRKRSGLSHTPSPPVFIYFPCTVHGDLTRASVRTGTQECRKFDTCLNVQSDIRTSFQKVCFNIPSITQIFTLGLNKLGWSCIFVFDCSMILRMVLPPLPMNSPHMLTGMLNSNRRSVSGGDMLPWTLPPVPLSLDTCKEQHDVHWAIFEAVVSLATVEIELLWRSHDSQISSGISSCQERLIDDDNFLAADTGAQSTAGAMHGTTLASTTLSITFSPASPEPAIGNGEATVLAAGGLFCMGFFLPRYQISPNRAVTAGTATVTIVPIVKGSQMEIIGDYEYSKKDLIGHGAFAVVFKGRLRKRPEKTVAIKSITKKNIAKSQNLLSKEIKILKELSSLHHENVVQLMECKETTNHVYLVMEYCNGGDLADYLQAKGTLSEDTISYFLKQIGAAMRALKDKDIVHRDMKPQNILLCFPPGSKNPPAAQISLKIADFGFARFLEDGVMAATLCGSPMYMAPEVIMSLQYDAKADLWSIGTIVFQCLTGKAPFQAQTPQQLKQYYEKTLELRPNIPSGTSPELKDLLLKLLKRNAKERIEFASPVPVPGRSPSISSDSPASLKANSASPLSGKMEYSPSPPAVQTHKSKSSSKLERISSGHKIGSPREGFMKVAKETPEHGSQASTPTEDFVMVHGTEGSDHSDTDDKAKMSTDGRVEPANTVTITPTSGAAMFQKDSSSPLGVNRPSSLQVGSPQGDSPSHSSPIPVPTQVAAYKRMCTSPTSPLAQQAKGEIERKDSSLLRAGSDPRVNIVDISPPVQFSIGTPPNSSPNPGAWRRGSISTSPNKYSTTPPSPLKKSGSVPAHLSPVSYTGPSSLPTIMDSPTKVPSTLHFPTNLNEMRQGGLVMIKPGTPSRTEGTSMLSQQLFKAAFGESPNQESRQVIPFGGGFGGKRERLNSGNSDKSDRSGGYVRRGQSIEASPPPTFMYAQSPSNMEGPIAFVAPELSEETLMDDNHNAILAKLNFALDLVECILEVARSRVASLSSFSESVSVKHGEQLNDQQPVPKFSEPQRRLEQLILHVRALHLLSAALQLARDEIKAGRLTISNSVKTVVKQMNEHYHVCVTVSRQLQQKLGTSVQTALSPQIVIATADKLIYNYAIEMCQTAALDELFGNPQECFRRYQTAQILLHSLAQQSRNTRDRESLNKYKAAVERRLSNLQGQAFYQHSMQVVT